MQAAEGFEAGLCFSKNLKPIRPDADTQRRERKEDDSILTSFLNGHDTGIFVYICIRFIPNIMSDLGSVGIHGTMLAQSGDAAYLCSHK